MYETYLFLQLVKAVLDDEQLVPEGPSKFMGVDGFYEQRECGNVLKRLKIRF